MAYNYYPTYTNPYMNYQQYPNPMQMQQQMPQQQTQQPVAQQPVAPSAPVTPQVRHCPACGAEVPEGEAFCGECGNKM